MAAAKALGEQVVPGEPGHWSDLEFEFTQAIYDYAKAIIQGFIEDMDDWGVTFK